MTKATSQATQGGRRCALVIGNSEYLRTAPLANASNDAAEVSRALKEIGWEVILRENLNRSAMEENLEAFREKTEDCDAALFFFAGHGVNIWGQNYLLPTDARIEFEDHVHQRSFYLGNILDGMVERSGVSIALIDACQENPFQRSTTRSLSPEYKSGGRSGAGLAHIKAPQGAFVAFAASPGELAYDTPGKHSPFTSALLENLSSDDSEITGIFLQVQDRVYHATGGAQRPWMHSDLPHPFYMSSTALRRKVSVATVRAAVKRPGPSPSTTVPSVTAKLRVAPSQQPALAPQPVAGVEPTRAPPISATGPDISINTIGEVASQLTLALGAAEWERLRDSRDIGQLTRFADHFRGYYGEMARERAQLLSAEGREHSNWLWASQRDSVDAYQRFLAVWPQGRYASIAYSRLHELEVVEKPVPRAVQARVRPAIAAREERYRGETSGDMQAAAHEEVPAETIRKGRVFRDSDLTPELVVIPAGEFVMGSSEENAHPSELPEHRVVIPRSLAVGVYLVTFDEWDAAFDAGGVMHQPSDKRWGRGKRPVINVSWKDAQAYVDWLSDETGFQYRLLSEAEWEYCCRAGTATAYATGTHLGRKAAHCSFDHWGCAGKTIEVGTYDANRFGLYDMHGNVAEWVEDTWSDTYSDVPRDGSAFVGNRQSPKVVRGGGWPDVPRSLRSSSRNRLKVTTRNDHTGFRVARILSANPRSDGPRNGGGGRH